MDEHDRSGEHAPDQPRRPAPASYALPSAVTADGQRTAAHAAHGAPPNSEETGPNPVYGRVTRAGAPSQTPAPPPAAPDPRWPPPVPPVPAAPGGGAGPPVTWPSPGPSSTLARTPGPPPWATAPPPLEPPDGYASWGRRVAGYLIDHAPSLVASVVLIISYVPLYVGLFRRDLSAHPTWALFAVGLVLNLAALSWSVHNRWVVAGRTGQSAGKRVMRTWLVNAVDGRPVGVLNAFLRDLLHTLDRLAYVGYLWPLWDDRRQTLADKIIQTVVVRTPVPPLTDVERSQRP